MSRRWRTVVVALALGLVSCGSESSRSPAMPATPVRTPARLARFLEERRGPVAPTATATTPEPMPTDPATPPPQPSIGVAPTTPEPTAAQPTPAPSAGLAGPTVEEEARELVEAWREAWESKRTDAYLAFYGEGFEGDGRNLAEWSRHKRKVLSRPGAIRVEVLSLQIELREGGARVRFRQRYSSSGLADEGEKTLELRRQAGRLRIVSESFAGDTR